MPVSLPDLNPKRELARKLIESVVSQIPLVGGPYVAMLSVTHRSDAEKKIAAWREKITKSVNNLENAINDLIPTIKLSSDASALGLWLSRNSKYGRPNSVTFAVIRAAFPNATKLELEDACGELEADELLRTTATIGQKVFFVRPMNLLFEVFDPIADEDANPRVDAALLAKFILEHDEGVAAAAMLAHLGWTARRLNPAISILCNMVGEGRKNMEIQREYACPYIRPDSKERARFRKYIEATLGPLQ